MTMIRRELPRSSRASWRLTSVSHRACEDSPFRSRPINSLDQGRPDEAGEFASDRRDDVLLRFPAASETVIPTMQPLLCRPGLSDDGRRRAVLPPPARRADNGSMAVVPGGFDQDAPQVGVSSFGDGAVGPSPRV